ncbi:MAG: phosphate/phosphite/phosphonate ABC transporter substrate-binding protein [Cyanobacteria bacterium P01_D01_bin.156]
MRFPSVWPLNSNRLPKILPIVLALLCFSCSKSTAPTISAAEENGPLASAEASELATGDPVYFGVLAIDSAVSVTERYRAFMDYLSQELGRPVELVILSQEDQFTKVAEGEIDFITSNPLASVQVQRLHNTEFLVTQNRPKTGTQFGGLIIVNRDSDIIDVADLKDKRAACVNFQTAAAGCTFQIYHLLQQDFDPHQDFSSFIENKSQDNIVLAVLNGVIDVGFIRTGQLEKMVTKGMLSSTDELRIIDIAEDGFQYPHTTDLYPEWSVASAPGTDATLVQQMRSALLSLPEDHPALAKMKTAGFVEPVDYGQLNQLIETLKLKTWDVQKTN